jgi:hypothetical protein
MSSFVTVFIRVLSAGCDVILIPVESTHAELIITTATIQNELPSKW